MDGQVRKAAIRGAVVVCLSLWGWLPPSGFCAQPDDKLLARIVADWQKRQERIGHIRYVIQRENITPKGSFTDDNGQPRNPPIPTRDIVKKTDLHLLLDPSHKRFRLERDNDSDLNKGLRVPRRTIIVLDGEWRKLEVPREGYVRPERDRDYREPDLYINKNLGPNPSLGELDHDLAPILFAHGLVGSGFAPPTFGEKLDPAKFHVHGHIRHGESLYVVLRCYSPRDKTRKSYAEYWVDVARDSAIVRHSLYYDAIQRTDWDITYQPSPQGWLPLHWEMATTRERFDHIPPNIRRLRVERYDLKPEIGSAHFTLAARPGMLVEEFDHAEARVSPKFFQVEFNGEWVETDLSRKKMPRIPLRNWLVCAAVLLGCGLHYLRGRRGKRWRFATEIANEIRERTLPTHHVEGIS